MLMNQITILATPDYEGYNPFRNLYQNAFFNSKSQFIDLTTFLALSKFSFCESDKNSEFFINSVIIEPDEKLCETQKIVKKLLYQIFISKEQYIFLELPERYLSLDEQSRFLTALFRHTDKTYFVYTQSPALIMDGWNDSYYTLEEFKQIISDEFSISI